MKIQDDNIIKVAIKTSLKIVAMLVVIFIISNVIDSLRLSVLESSNKKLSRINKIRG